VPAELGAVAGAVGAALWAAERAGARPVRVWGALVSSCSPA